ncbi:MAG: M48 family metalloprotease [Candidatus Micrarchaeota archaeon]|nr:M48 family metalloprotease [Candidatus Micrarchaeota archaeon]
MIQLKQAQPVAAEKPAGAQKRFSKAFDIMEPEGLGRNSPCRNGLDLEKSFPGISQEIDRMLKQAGLQQIGFMRSEERDANAGVNRYNIVITSGLLEKANMRQLLAVIAHELGHIKFNHISSAEEHRKRRNSELGDIIGVGLAIDDNLASKAKFVFMVVRLIWREVKKNFSKDEQMHKEEYEADSFAVSMGYGKELAEILRKMEGGLAKRILSLASRRTHPPVKKRIARINELIGNESGCAHEA